MRAPSWRICEKRTGRASYGQLSAVRVGSHGICVKASELAKWIEDLESVSWGENPREDQHIHRPRACPGTYRQRKEPRMNQPQPAHGTAEAADERSAEMNAPGPLWTFTDARVFLRCSRNQLYQLLAAGMIPHRRFGKRYLRLVPGDGRLQSADHSAALRASRLAHDDALCPSLR